MTQEEFDGAFNRVFKAGFFTLLFGGFIMAAIGLPAFALFEALAPFFVGTGLALVGGLITVGAFGWDIACNPRWRRRP